MISHNYCGTKNKMTRTAEQFWGYSWSWNPWIFHTIHFPDCAFCLFSSMPYQSRHRRGMNRQLNWSRPEVLPGTCDELIGRMVVKGFGEIVFKMILRASLVAQWLRNHLPMQGTWVRTLVREDPTCHRATKPMRHNYWACTRARKPQLLKPTHLEPMFCNKRSHRNEKHVHSNEE